jgi:hypothetical protein
MSGMFSMMTTLNSLVAICAGIIAEWLVSTTGTAKAPFLASIGCLMVSFVAISKHWVGRYRLLHFRRVVNRNRARTMVPVIMIRLKMPLCCNKKKRSQIIQLPRRYDTSSEVSSYRSSQKSHAKRFLDSKILVLALTSCFFEGSLFLFIFFKFPALKLSHKLAGSTEGMCSSAAFTALGAKIRQNSHLA